MQRLSSRSTWFQKKIFPAIWFGVLVAAAVFLIYEAIASHQAGLGFAAILPAVMILVGIRLFGRYVFDLADEVWLEDDHLLVRRGEERVTIKLDNVTDIETRMLQNPSRMTFTLRVPCAVFADRVRFIPAAGMALGFNPVARALRRRVRALSGRSI